MFSSPNWDDAADVGISIRSRATITIAALPGTLLSNFEERAGGAKRSELFLHLAGRVLLGWLLPARFGGENPQLLNARFWAFFGNVDAWATSSSNPFRLGQILAYQA